MPLENGYLLNNRYRIHDILGQGGMGAVYRATDENLDVTVAIKENAFFSEDYARQFRREAKVLATLRHPNLPRVFDYFVIDQQGQYLVMDYIEGDDLRQWMNKEGVISEIEAVQIGIEICDALIYLHSRVPAITHRDIKPGNIKITPDGEVLLVDFGLVKINYGKEMTTTAARAMTPGYSPPEQYGDTPTDHRSDIFSLGATLYAALAGYLPEDSLARATGKTELTPLRNYNPDVSSNLASIIEKSLALRYQDRWQSACDLKDALLEVKETIPNEEWQSDRLVFVEDPKLKPGQNGLDELRSKKTEENANYLEKKRKKLFAPVWIVLVSLFLLLLIILGASLIWPENFRSVLSRGSDPERTITLAVRESETQDSLSGTEEVQGSPGGPSSTPEPVETTSSAAGINPTITPSGGGIGMIAYVSESAGLPQIWLLDVDNGLTYQLTRLDEGACQPDWSPDGKRIVFTSPCPGKRSRYYGSSLFIFDLNDNELTQLTDSLEGDFDPAWSPMGDWIAYTSSLNGQLQLFKININDSSVVKLSDGAYNDSDPAWSAGGGRLAFIRTRGVDQVWLMDFDGSNPVQFTLSGEIDNSNPSWFSKEDLILFSQTLGLGSPSKQIFGMRLGDIGKDEEYPIIPAAQMDYIPLMDNVDVSPDGSLLAFDYWYFDVLSDIYIMRFPGLDLQQMTDDPAPDYDPVWRP
jgi:serine/threonine protein kinase